MTIVLKNVAKSAFTSPTPTLAKIAVRAANTAESSAQNCHDVIVFIISFILMVFKINRGADG
jgi:hypothetical protein